MSLVLIGGGSRSGKSRHALAWAKQHGPRLGFVATGEAFDDEMRDRIAKHRADRDPAFTTLEEPVALSPLLERYHADFDVIVIDCLTLWLSNLMMRDSTDLEAEFRSLIATAAALPIPVVCVTNEVGCGIVPENALARRFRDEAGRLNQMVAEAATEVWWMVFGCPLRVK